MPFLFAVTKLQFLKAFKPSVAGGVSLSISTFISPLQPENAPLFMLATFSGIVTSVRLLQL